MRVTVHVSGFYDWEKIPADVEVKEADIKAKRVKPSNDGGWLMRVSKTADTHTSVMIPESQIIAIIIAEMVRDKIALTRTQALGHYLSRHVMPHHAHKNWMRGFEVHDDGGDEVLLRAKIDVHVAAGNIDALDVDGIVAAYLAPVDSAKHVDHLHAHFGVAKPNHVSGVSQ